MNTHAETTPVSADIFDADLLNQQLLTDKALACCKEALHSASECLHLFLILVISHCS